MDPESISSPDPIRLTKKIIGKGVTMFSSFKYLKDK